QNNSAAVAARQKRHAQLIRGQACHSAQQSNAQPTEAGRHRPAPAAPQRLMKQQCQQAEVENDQPPGGNIAHIGVSETEPVACFDENFAQQQRPVNEGNKQRRQRRHYGGSQQQQRTGKQRRRGQQVERNAQKQTDGGYHVVPRCG